MNSFCSRNTEVKEVAFAEKFRVAGAVGEIQASWDILQWTGTLYEYFLKLSESYLIVQGQIQNNAVKIFRGSKVKKSSEWRLHLGVVIRSQAFKISYTKLLVGDGIKEL